MSGPAGHYAGTFEPHANGPTSCVEAQFGDLKLTAENVRWQSAASISSSRSSTSTKKCSPIAEAAGGRYAHISTADQLISQLDRSQRKNRPIAGP